MLSTSGILASSFLGWPSIFYISGTASSLWAILWLFCGSNSPADHEYISVEEREFIQSSLGHVEEDPEHNVKRTLNTPWKDIFTSMAFYALAIVHAAHNWGFWTLLTEMPTYMKGVLGFDIKKVCNIRNTLFNDSNRLITIMSYDVKNATQSLYHENVHSVRTLVQLRKN